MRKIERNIEKNKRKKHMYKQNMKRFGEMNSQFDEEMRGDARAFAVKLKQW